MKVLLDTHVLIWTQDSPSNLGRKTRALVIDPGNEILVSAASTLEIARLVYLGQIVLKVGLDIWLAKALSTLQARSLAIDHRIAQEAYSLPGNFHKDPADRLLVATARLEGATLVTADDLILTYPHAQVLDAHK
ncbi:MAG: type II toxin-antitoxin system VapC family toxin [Planctomycetes bacterium]|nr:type II toxin-antitoxin system VapC family toxin [Planctomycetota bacterium]